jgi:malonyl-CoA O-methyltransferase
MREAFSRAAARYDDVAVLARETGARMADRLDWVTLVPRRCGDLGCATGDGAFELQRRFPDCQVLAADYSLAMLDAVRARARADAQSPSVLNADVRAMPLATGSLDLIWSNLVLHWLDDPRPAFREAFRLLHPGGLFTFAMLGPDTLRELRGAGWPGVRRFIDMHDVGDMLVGEGFAEPVLDVDFISMTYRRRSRFLADQRLLGVRDALLGKPGYRSARAALRAWRSDEAGSFPVTFEVVFGHAWRAEDRTADGRQVLRFHPPQG